MDQIFMGKFGILQFSAFSNTWDHNWRVIPGHIEFSQILQSSYRHSRRSIITNNINQLYYNKQQQNIPKKTNKQNKQTKQNRIILNK